MFVVDSLFIVAVIVCKGSVLIPCFVMQCNVISSFAIMLMRTRELLVVLFYCLGLCAVCLVYSVWFWQYLAPRL